MSTVLITGGTGLIGRALTKALLKRNYDVIILTRSGRKQASINPKLRYAYWDIDKKIIDRNALSAADSIIHLAGAGVGDKRWTKKRKQEIINSRVEGSKLLIESLENVPNKVKAVISASGMGWYGNDHTPARVFVESDPSAKDFLGNTCKQWEESIEPARQLGKRLVKLRIGMVLSKDGGALKEFLKPLRFGIAAILGNGKQIISWIHIDDLVGMFIAGIENENIDGVYNAVTAQHVSNKEFILQLAKSRKRFYIPVYVPSFILKIVVGEMSIEVLKSATLSANKIQQAEFSFHFPSLADAFTDLSG